MKALWRGLGQSPKKKGRRQKAKGRIMKGEIYLLILILLLFTLIFGFDFCFAVEVGLKYFWYVDGAVGILVIFDDGDHEA